MERKKGGICIVVLSLLFWMTDSSSLDYETLFPSISVFKEFESGNYSVMVMGGEEGSLLVGGRDALYRLRASDLNLMERSEWKSSRESSSLCVIKGQSRSQCRNYVKVLSLYGDRVFTCGTNAFNPKCSWRSTRSLKVVEEWVDGRGKCPYNPDSGLTSLMTPEGIYYIGTSTDFMSSAYAIYRMDGATDGFKRLLGTATSDDRWLSHPHFVYSFQRDRYVYFLMREVAVEDYGESVYSRIVRVCKNDQSYGAQTYWSTFLKARLNCSMSGKLPFYFDQITSAYFQKGEDIVYGTFSTGDNPIHGSAVCSFHIQDVEKAFESSFMLQESPDSIWKAVSGDHKHFKCLYGDDTDGLLTYTSREYQLVQKAVQQRHGSPIFYENLEHYSHIVVDVIKRRGPTLHVVFLTTRKGFIKKISHDPETGESCLIETLYPFDQKNSPKINSMIIAEATRSIYLSTDESVIRVDIQRCRRLQSRNGCLNLMDPYCGWDEERRECLSVWNSDIKLEQKPHQCLTTTDPINGQWGSWSLWEQCYHKSTVLSYSDTLCLCRKRLCDNPKPQNGGSSCDGYNLEVTNCTRNGQWTEWSEFSSCSQSCDAGMRVRRRHCGNPAPTFGGKPCIGRDTDHQYCDNLPPCESKGTLVNTKKMLSPWSEWSNCSAACGSGFMSRTRVCYSFQCEDECNVQYKKCIKQDCQDTIKITDWTPWFQMNSSSGPWMEKRYRFTYMVPAHMKDSGSMQEEKRYCQNKNSCTEVSYGEGSSKSENAWFEWSECTKTCGVGKQIKVRTCLPNESNCKGLTIVERPCNVQPCLPNYGCWSEWSSCEGLSRRRTRSCGDDCSSNQKIQEESCVIVDGSGSSCLNDCAVTLESDCGIPCSTSIIMATIISGFVGGIFCGGITIFLIMKYKRSFIESIVSPKYISAKSQNLYVSLPLWDIHNKQLSNIHESKTQMSEESDSISLKTSINPRNSMTFHSPLDNLDADKRYS